MMKTKSPIILVTAVALIVGYFLPWLSTIFTFSAWDFVFGEYARMINMPSKYISIAIPLTAVFIIFCALFNKHNYFLPKIIVFLIPIISLILTLGLSGTKGIAKSMNSASLHTVLNMLGLGFWLTFVAALLLPLLLIKKKR